jgi:hypothetical protein
MAVLTPEATAALPRFSYTLPEVAVMTGLGLEGIQIGCRQGQIEHVHRGGARVMTPKQIKALLDAHTVQPTAAPAAGAKSVDELAQFRAETNARLSRQSNSPRAAGPGGGRR